MKAQWQADKAYQCRRVIELDQFPACVSGEEHAMLSQQEITDVQQLVRMINGHFTRELSKPVKPEPRRKKQNQQ
jgi:hypothetical protein